MRTSRRMLLLFVSAIAIATLLVFQPIMMALAVNNVADDTALTPSSG